MVQQKSSTYIVPTMAETDAEYRTRVERLVALQAALQQLVRDKHRLERELAAMPVPRVTASVAALLGDADVDARQVKAKELAETRRAIIDHETAIALQTTRVEQSKVSAGRAVCEAVRPEFQRRVVNLVAPIQAAMEAFDEFKALVADLESDNVSWHYLGDMTPYFLGDPQDGHAVRWMREVRGAGYVD